MARKSPFTKLFWMHYVPIKVYYIFIYKTRCIMLVPQATYRKWTLCILRLLVH